MIIAFRRGRAMAASDPAMRFGLGYRRDRRLQLGRSGQLIDKTKWLTTRGCRAAHKVSHSQLVCAFLLEIK